jgi:hypothetical protein
MGTGTHWPSTSTARPHFDRCPDGGMSDRPSLPVSEPADPPDMAINAGLRALGIQTAAGRHDEFATIGLDKHRWTSDWLAE